MDKNFAFAGANPVLKTAESMVDPADGFKTLVMIYRTDPDPNMRQQAQNAIERFSQTPDTLKAVIRLYVNDPDPNIRLQASNILDQLPSSPDVIAFLHDMYQIDPDQNLRQFALHKVGQLLANTALNSAPPPAQYFQNQYAAVIQAPATSSPVRTSDRRRSRRPNNTISAFMLLIVIGGFLIFIIVTGINDVNTRSKLASSGIAIQATVTGKATYKGGTSSVSYQFVDPRSGTTFSATESSSEYVITTTVNVCYLPADPTVSLLCDKTSTASIQTVERNTIIEALGVGLVFIGYALVVRRSIRATDKTA